MDKRQSKLKSDLKNLWLCGKLSPEEFKQLWEVVLILGPESGCEWFKSEIVDYVRYVKH